MSESKKSKKIEDLSVLFEQLKKDNKNDERLAFLEMTNKINQNIQSYISDKNGVFYDSKLITLWDKILQKDVIPTDREIIYWIIKLAQVYHIKEPLTDPCCGSWWFLIEWNRNNFNCQWYDIVSDKETQNVIKTNIQLNWLNLSKVFFWKDSWKQINHNDFKVVVSNPPFWKDLDFYYNLWKNIFYETWIWIFIFEEKIVKEFIENNKDTKFDSFKNFKNNDTPNYIPLIKFVIKITNTKYKWINWKYIVWFSKLYDQNTTSKQYEEKIANKILFWEVSKKEDFEGIIDFLNMNEKKRNEIEYGKNWLIAYVDEVNDFKSFFKNEAKIKDIQIVMNEIHKSNQIINTNFSKVISKLSISWIPETDKKIIEIIKGIQESHKIKSEKLLEILLALTVSNFLILSWPSGVGKTSLVSKVAEHIWWYYYKFPVKSNFTDETWLLGYWNPLLSKYEWTELLEFIFQSSQYLNKNIPFFLLLDEMNLSRIENYFSDVLINIDYLKSAGNNSISINLFDVLVDNNAKFQNILFFINKYILWEDNIDIKIFDGVNFINYWEFYNLNKSDIINHLKKNEELFRDEIVNISNSTFKDNVDIKWSEINLTNVHFAQKSTGIISWSTVNWNNVNRQWNVKINEYKFKKHYTLKISININIHSNFNIVWTINEDETTFTLSNKVLDRAFYIDLQVDDLFENSNYSSIDEFLKDIVKTTLDVTKNWWLIFYKEKWFTNIPRELIIEEISNYWDILNLYEWNSPYYMWNIEQKLSYPILGKYYTLFYENKKSLNKNDISIMKNIISKKNDSIWIIWLSDYPNIIDYQEWVIIIDHKYIWGFLKLLTNNTLGINDLNYPDITKKQVMNYMSNEFSLFLWKDLQEFINQLNKLIQQINPMDAIGYRAIEDIALFMSNYKKFVNDFDEKKALDTALCNKVWPKMKNYFVLWDKEDIYNSILNLIEKFLWKNSNSYKVIDIIKNNLYY